MLLDSRQQLAQSLAKELGKFDGLWVINPMPLDNSARGLRIQILEASSDKNRIFQAIADWGLGTPVFVSMTPRIIGSGMAMASVYEIPVEKERAIVIDDRRIPDAERADSQKKGQAEVEAILKYVRGGK
jgi:hypothetical protein